MHWFLRLLTPPDLAQTKITLESGIKNQHFESGDIVFTQGDLGDNVYVIQKGECKVFREQDGVQQHLATLRAGDFFGEMAVLSDQARNATIQASTAMNVLLISRRDFEKLRQSVPAFGEAFNELATFRRKIGPSKPDR